MSNNPNDSDWQFFESGTFDTWFTDSEGRPTGYAVSVRDNTVDSKKSVYWQCGNVTIGGDPPVEQASSSSAHQQFTSSASSQVVSTTNKQTGQQPETKKQTFSGDGRDTESSERATSEGTSMYRHPSVQDATSDDSDWEKDFGDARDAQTDGVTNDTATSKAGGFGRAFRKQ
ncbi:uncharacterized protein I303_100554 [Kwoniella dejecticola CBS 10117]|uniref:Uncharacterized protein n=1 Tax=Kwoniella dejecticola CBS 10117 TaxID=1296121 RepID=A0A1A6AFD5_9TREE|nr:uncharacterized protein I303_00555 [Kwoniella dejecticola CBS 10117]OBR88738.1 hypothetical protein I303_00555 [Kwoniella dejecticola CBS 10117]